MLRLVEKDADPVMWAKAQTNLGNALSKLAEGNRLVHLTEALVHYDLALSVWHPTSFPEWFAITQRNRGAVLFQMAKLPDCSKPKELLREAIVCYDTALQAGQDNISPTNWVKTEDYKSTALLDLADLLTNRERMQALREALACYDVLLAVYDRLADEAEGKKTLRKKVRVLHLLIGQVERTERIAILRDFVTCYDSLLRTSSPDRDRMDWVVTHNDKGATLRELANLLEGSEKIEILREAITCFNAVLNLPLREVLPLHWAAIQNNKGVVLRELTKLVEPSEKAEVLREAVSCHEHALGIYTSDQSAVERAATLRNKGIALEHLAEAMDNSGQIKSELLHESIACYDAALTVYTRDSSPTDWAATLSYRGNALLDLSELAQPPQEESLNEAITCYDAALTVYALESAPTDWAAIKGSKGNVLKLLGEIKVGEERTEKLQAALTCYNDALEGYTRVKKPVDWALLQSSKGAIFRRLAGEAGSLLKGEMLRSAAECYDHALLELRRETHPQDWAAAQSGKGYVLSMLGLLSAGSERTHYLQEAVACFNLALLERRRESTPIEWAQTQTNRGNALSELARTVESSVRAETLRRAITSYEALLKVYTREEMPLEWARAQMNRGVALSELAELLAGAEQAKALQEALSCFQAALSVSRPETTPDIWARAQANKGSALHRLTDTLRGSVRRDVLEEAIACFNDALTIFTFEHSFIDWVMAQNGRGLALRALSEELTGAAQHDALREAIRCYDAVLAVFPSEGPPVQWILLQNNKGSALSGLAFLLEGEERERKLREALTCYDAALTLCSPEDTPADWAMMHYNKGSVYVYLADGAEDRQQAIEITAAAACYDAAFTVYTPKVQPVATYTLAYAAGIHMFERGHWVLAARYLAWALDAIDELFRLEITAQNRQSMLKEGASLTGCLAYALIRSQTPQHLWQAAEALERGRARATGEAIMRQEAELEVAERLAPDLLRELRRAGNRLSALTLKMDTTSRSEFAQEFFVEAEETSIIRSRIAEMSLNAQLIDYEEARQARAEYERVLVRIREIIPDFLQKQEKLDSIARELAVGESLVYIANTPAGAATVLIQNSSGIAAPIIEGWWDGQLTNAQIVSLLGGATAASGAGEKHSVGLLEAQHSGKNLRKVLHRTMQALGMADGVVARLATYCQRQNMRRIVIIPCGVMGLLPLHAALVSTLEGEIEPLLDIVRISYTASAHIWYTCRQRAASGTIEPPHALIVSDPEPLSATMPVLKGAKSETRAINKIITRQLHGQSKVFTGKKATYRAVQKPLLLQAENLTHVHFACHGVADVTDPATSGLVLAYEARLRIGDLLKPALRFKKLRLAVLSACQTALPGLELPDEVISLPSSWLVCGASSVLASLWPVSDNMTAALMQKFYELHLLDRLDPVESLWLAQRWLRQLPCWREDCLAAGASLGATGPDMSEVVRELERASHRNKARLPVGLTSARRTQIKPESSPGGSVRGFQAPQDRARSEQMMNWENAEHWAAFVVYGT